MNPTLSSPKWGPTTKTIVALTVVGLVAVLLFSFRQVIGPVILAFILAFLLHPLASRLSKTVRLSWRSSVNLIYLSLLILLIALFTATGIAIVQQSQSLFDFLDRFITDLPQLVQDLSSENFVLGPFQFNLSQFDLSSLADQLLAVVRPVLGQAGSLLSKVATGAANVVGWGLFILLVSYYLLAEGGQIRENLVFVDVPGYNEDTRRLARELARTWDAFLRGQLLICLLTVVVYYLLLTILGLRFSLAIALMAGLARFVPYIGPWITWSVTALVGILQTTNYFGLESWKYAGLIIIICVLVDQVMDNVVVPRLMGKALGVHPAGVLIAAIIATNLIGIIGLVLAAPVLATVALVGRYVGRKLFDQNPWPEPEQPPELPGGRVARRARAWWRFLRREKK